MPHWTPEVVLLGGIVSPSEPAIYSISTGACVARGRRPWYRRSGVYAQRVTLRCRGTATEGHTVNRVVQVAVEMSPPLVLLVRYDHRVGRLH